MKKLIAISLLSLSFFACTKHEGSDAARVALTPEDTVRAFVEISATAKDPADRKKVQELCLGDLRRTFERMTDEAFRMLYLDSNVRILDLKIVDSSTTGEMATVHYQVTIENKQGTDPTKEINEREVQLTRSQGAWYVASIRMRGSDNIAFTRGMIF